MAGETISRAELERRHQIKQDAWAGNSFIGGGNPMMQTAGALAQQNPFWQQQLQAGAAPQAFNIAEQIMAPLKPGGENTFGTTAESLLGGIDPANPGMSDEQFNQMLKAIAGQGAKEKAGIASTLAKGGGGSVDPEGFARMLAKTSEGRMSAVGGAHATRASLNQQGIQGLLRALAPFFSTQQRGQDAFSDDLSSLFGDILQGGVFTV